MQNPLEHEEAAFRVVLYAIAYFVPIVLASWIASWLGFVVFVAATAVVVVLVERSRRRGRAREALQAPGEPAAVADTRRVVAVANETLLGPHLRDTLAGLAEGGAEDVLLVCPVPPLASDEDEAAAAARLDAAVGALRAAGVDARGMLERADPLDALDAALGSYGADEVVVATPPAGTPAVVDESVAAAARERFAGAVTHVVG